MPRPIPSGRWSPAMKTSRPLLLAAPLAAVLSAGCLSDMSAVTVRGFQTITAGDGMCLPSGATAVQGLLDTAAGTGYMLAVELVNEMPATDVEEVRTDSSTVFLDTAEVSFRTSEGAAFPAPAPERIPVSIVVEPAGESVAALQVMSPTNGAALAGASDGYLIIEVRLTGKTADGAAVASAAAEFPVRVCANCVTPCPAGEEVVSACSPGQPDGVVCAAGN